MKRNQFAQWFGERVDLASENGVVFIEATIALTAFMFFVVTLLSIVNVCYAQAKIGTALNETAKELSEYSYLYAVTGLNDKEKRLYGEVKGTKEQISNVSEGIGELYGALKSSQNTVDNASMDNLTETMDQLQTDRTNIENAENKIYKELNNIANDPKTFVLGVGKLMGYEVLQEGKSKLIAAPLTKCLIKKHLKSTDDQKCDSYLASLRIVPGGGREPYLNGIDFGDSTLFTNGDNSIKLVAKYSIKIIALLPINIEMNFCQSAETEGWFGK